MPALGAEVEPEAAVQAAAAAGPILPPAAAAAGPILPPAAVS